jgi:hypothetical protein
MPGTAVDGNDPKIGAGPEADMTLLTHDYPVRQARVDNRAQTPIGASREGLMHGFFRFAITIFLSTAVLAGIIALKTEIYLTRFTH